MKQNTQKFSVSCIYQWLPGYRVFSGDCDTYIYVNSALAQCPYYWSGMFTKIWSFRSLFLALLGTHTDSGACGRRE